MKILILLVVGALLGSCTKHKDVNLEVRVAFPTRSLNLDPHRMEDLYSMFVVNQLFARLFRFRPDGTVIQDLVDSWDLESDNKTYHFHLRRAYFSDGRPVTARHVEASLKRLFVVGSAMASDMSLITGGKDALKSKAVDKLAIRATGEKTLEIKTSAPTGLLITLLAAADCAVLPIETPFADLLTSAAMAVSGPYRIKSFSQSELILEKWRDSPIESKHPPTIARFTFIDQMTPDMLVDGKVSDTSSFISFDEKTDIFEKSQIWKAVVSEASNERFILLNPKILDRNFRLWLASKVRTDVFAGIFADSSIVPAYGLIPPVLPGALKQAQYGLEAKSLTKQYRLDIVYPENLPYQEKFISYLSRVWESPKVRLNFKKVKVTAYLSVVRAKKAACVIAAKGMDYPEGFATVAYFRSGVEGNFYFIENLKVDKLIDLAAKTVDNESRALIYEQIQREVLKEATVVPLAFGSWKRYYWTNRIKHVPSHPIGIQSLPIEMLEMND